MDICGHVGRFPPSPLPHELPGAAGRHPTALQVGGGSGDTVGRGLQTAAAIDCRNRVVVVVVCTLVEA